MCNLCFFHRCPLIEPGPVTTSFNESAKLLRESIDISTADDKTQQLLKTALKEMYRSVQSESKTPDEVAAFIKSVILCFIIQQIVTMPIYGQEALNICHAYMTDI